MENSRREYCEYIHNRIVQKLSQAKDWELLSFALLGLNLLLRQSDILRLEWDQVDFSNCTLNNVMLIKGDSQILIASYNLDDQLVDVLAKLHSNTNDPINIFPNLNRYIVGKKIGDMIGDIRFCTQELRIIGTCLKLCEGD